MFSRYSYLLSRGTHSLRHSFPSAPLSRLSIRRGPRPVLPCLFFLLLLSIFFTALSSFSKSSWRLVLTNTTSIRPLLILIILLLLLLRRSALCLGKFHPPPARTRMATRTTTASHGIAQQTPTPKQHFHRFRPGGHIGGHRCCGEWIGNRSSQRHATRECPSPVIGRTPSPLAYFEFSLSSCPHSLASRWAGRKGGERAAVCLSGCDDGDGGGKGGCDCVQASGV